MWASCCSLNRKMTQKIVIRSFIFSLFLVYLWYVFLYVHVCVCMYMCVYTCVRVVCEGQRLISSIFFTHSLLIYHQTKLASSASSSQLAYQRSLYLPNFGITWGSSCPQEFSHGYEGLKFQSPQLSSKCFIL